ncbi:MAG: hypothetical protein AAF441_20335 [Pseudomonadota bacterium]
MVDAAARYYPFDAMTVFCEDETVTATGNLSTGGTEILTVGDGRVDGCVVVDVTAIDIANSDEKYDLIIQGSNSASFASGIQNLASLDFGDATQRDGGGDVDSLIGRYEMPVQNAQAGTEYKYMRARMVVSGTSPSITLTAHLAMKT